MGWGTLYFLSNALVDRQRTYYVCYVYTCVYVCVCVLSGRVCVITATLCVGVRRVCSDVNFTAPFDRRTALGNSRFGRSWLELSRFRILARENTRNREKKSPVFPATFRDRSFSSTALRAEFVKCARGGITKEIGETCEVENAFRAR